ncbi:hypothetical protein [Kaistella sp.]|uniref:hypothetical protein n=1 Tax=Kaistella sp. TaxID=2782235 RepID=UPI0035A0B44D
MKNFVEIILSLDYETSVSIINDFSTGIIAIHKICKIIINRKKLEKAIDRRIKKIINKKCLFCN